MVCEIRRHFYLNSNDMTKAEQPKIKRTGTKTGAKPSEYTYRNNGEKVSNDKVVDVLVKEVLSPPIVTGKQIGRASCRERV